MCGIAGILKPNPDKPENLEKAIAALQHRGPDGSGIWTAPHIGLAHTRLSILDLSNHASQPMASPDGRYHLVFNGEIYNYLEIRKELTTWAFKSGGDTEVLLASYATWGVSCLQKFRGMFAFGIWDERDQTLFLARDRCGEKPLYYTHNSSGFYFASELKALLKLSCIRPQLNPAAIDQYLHYQYVPEPATPLQGVHKLPAAHSLLLRPNHYQSDPKPYWTLHSAPAIDDSPERRLRQELETVTDLTLRSDVPVAIALSGGLDSGIITALAAKRSPETLHAFCIGYQGAPSGDERLLARETAKHCGVEFHEIELHPEGMSDFFPELVSLLDDPIADLAAYGHYAVARGAADQGFKVLLTGIGGDELFWGYEWFRKALKLTQKKQSAQPLLPASDYSLLRRLSQTPLWQRLQVSRKIPDFFTHALHRGFEAGLIDPTERQQSVCQNLLPDFLTAQRLSSKVHPSDFLRSLSQHNSSLPFRFDVDQESDLPTRMTQILISTWLTSNCLALGDRVSMASGVETRVPLVDFRLMEVAIGLRKTHPDHQLPSKDRLKKSVEDLLPPTLLQRTKQPFQPPWKEWMRAVYQKHGHLLRKGSLVEAGVLRSEAIPTLEAHPRNSFYLYKLLLLEIWWRRIASLS